MKPASHTMEKDGLNKAVASSHYTEFYNEEVCESYSCKNCYGSGLNSCRACNGIAAVRCSVCMGRKQVACNFQNRDQDERMPPVPNLSQIVQF